MSKSTHNEGVIISGGNVSIGGSFAVGPLAVANSTINQVKAPQESGLKEISEHLEALVQVISEQVQSQAKREELHRYTHEVAEELKQKKPDKSKLTSILQCLASGAASISPVVDLAQKIAKLVASFF